jgi:hypothetical protein
MRSIAICCLCLSVLIGCSQSPNPAKDPCAANMMQIWREMMSWEDSRGRDRFPSSLSVLTDVSPSLFVCPSSGHQPGAITNVDQWTDYIYVPDAQDWMRLDLAILIDPPENHKGKYGYVLFGGGWVEQLLTSEVRALIREPWCKPTPGRKSIGIYLGPNGSEIPFAVYAKTNVTVRIPERWRATYHQ